MGLRQQTDRGSTRGVSGVHPKDGQLPKPKRCCRRQRGAVCPTFIRLLLQLRVRLDRYCTFSFIKAFLLLIKNDESGLNYCGKWAHVIECMQLASCARWFCTETRQT